MAFQQLAGVAFTLRAEATFSLCELACEKFSHDSSHSENVASARRVELHLQLLVL